MTTPRALADVELLEKLILGKLPVAEADRLAVEYADDSRVAELAEAVANRDDTLIGSLRNHRTLADPNTDALIRRLVQRLRGAAPTTDSTSQTIPPLAEGFSGRPPMPDHLEYFQIEKILGEGGMGTVYLAHDTRLQRRVALKTLKRDLAVSHALRDRFLYEARSAARLEHDHIIPIYYVGEADGIPFLAMPYLQGEPLDQRLGRGAASGKLLPLAETIRIARQIASGLEVAHAQSLIHRDIKPGNVWLESPSGRVKILDFGLVRSVKVDTNLTASGAILGTPAYMAPEQARGSSVDHRADLFSLGCVLYEMLTGRRPFAGPDAMAVLLSVTQDTPKAPHEVNPHCPPDLSRLTMRLLAKQPDHRPASARMIVDALAAMEATVDAASVSTPSPRGEIAARDRTEQLAASAEPKLTPKTMPRKRRLLPLVAVGLLLASLGVGVLFGGTIYRIATNQGELVIEVDDKDVEVKIVHNGLVVLDKLNKREFTLTAGKGEIEVRDRDGIKLATKQFELTRNGKTTVKVTLKELAEARKLKPTKDADREAALWVLSIGGSVKVNGRGQWLETAAELPTEPFRLTLVRLFDKQQVSDAGLARFEDCKNLTHLDLSKTKVSDAGLAHFKGCKNLTYLGLHSTKVSDAGLAHFEDCKYLAYLGLQRARVSDAGLAQFANCKNLKHLELGFTPVSDAGLAHFANCKNLEILYLYNTQVGDAGLAHFVNHKNLTHLDLKYTKVTDAGLAHFKGCKNLTHLDLDGTQVSDAGLAHFKGCKNLEVLALHNTQVSDAGLAHFADCKKIGQLVLPGTKVTDAGLAHFKGCKNLVHINLDGTQVSDVGLEMLANLPNLNSLQIPNTRISKRGYDLLKSSKPKCDITWSEPNRTAAQQVLALGGSVTIAAPGKDDARPVKAVGDLPHEFFQVRRVSLEGVKKPLGELLITLSRLQFAEFDRLESIDLAGTTPADFVPLMTVAGLRELSLAGAGLTDESLAQFPKLPTLRRLVLDGNAIKGSGLVRLQALPELSELSLGGPALSDLFAEDLAGLTKLKKLSLVSATLTDAGVRHLKRLTGLTTLDLRKTKVTAKGIDELKKALPKAEIEWDGGAAEPKGP